MIDYNFSVLSESFMRYLTFLLFFFYLIACSDSGKNKKFTVITGIVPIALLIQEIGGDRVKVQSVIPSKVDPHSFTLKPSDVIKISRADIAIILHSHIDGALLHGTPKKKTHHLTSHARSSHHSCAKEGNAHLWLSFLHPLPLARKIVQILSVYFPEDRELFQKNYQNFSKKLEELYISERKRHGCVKVAVIQQHSAWDHMLLELGVEKLGVLEAYEGEQLSLRRIAQLVTTAKTHDKKVLLIADTFSGSSTTTLKRISKETGARVLQFNPMISLKGSSSIIDILRDYSSLLLME